MSTVITDVQCLRSGTSPRPSTTRPSISRRKERMKCYDCQSLVRHESSPLPSSLRPSAGQHRPILANWPLTRSIVLSTQHVSNNKGQPFASRFMIEFRCEEDIVFTDAMDIRHISPVRYNIYRNDHERRRIINSPPICTANIFQIRCAVTEFIAYS